LAAPLQSQTAEATDRLLRAIFRRRLARRCITFDNGSEFAGHQNLSLTLGMKTRPLLIPIRPGGAAPSTTPTAFSGATSQEKPTSPSARRSPHQRRCRPHVSSLGGKNVSQITFES
jgi:hypothetical protein